MAVPVYDQVLLSPEYSPGARGGGEWRTRIVRLPSGLERRFDVQADAVYRWQIDYPALTRVMAEDLIDFWHQQKGSTHAFRFLDFTDYTVTDAPLYPTGAPTVQLVRTYGVGVREWRRNIYAPAGPSPTNTVTLKKNGVTLAHSLNLATGLVTLTALASQNITGITVGATTVIQFGVAPNALFTVGSLIYLAGIVGTTALNGQVGTITVVGATSITLNILSTGMPAWVSGGTAAKYLHSTDLLTWSGQYHNIVRFDMSWPEFGAEAPDHLTFNSVQLIEVKE